MSVPANIETGNATPIGSASLEAVELELALQATSGTDTDFEKALGPALDEAGARLLFDIRMIGDNQNDYVAAVSVGEGDDRQFLIVTRPSSGSPSVELAETSQLPIARLAPAFADVMERWRAAA